MSATTPGTRPTPGAKPCLKCWRPARPKPETEIIFTTGRYENSSYDWVEIERFERYGQFGRVRARWEQQGRTLRLETANVARLALRLEGLPGLSPGGGLSIQSFVPGATALKVTVPSAGPLRLESAPGGYRTAGEATSSRPVKRKGLEGPIYQALTDRVLLVYGTGGGQHNQTLRQAMRFADWGELPDVHFLIRPDTAVTERDIERSHLVLFGDERSNRLIGRINAMSPVRFEGEAVVAGRERFPRDQIAFKCVFPNPLKPDRLVLLNYHEEWDYTRFWSFLSMVKLLPDYFIYRRGADTPYETPVLKAGFFNEQWTW